MFRSRTGIGRALGSVDRRAVVVELALVVAVFVVLGAYVNLVDAVVGPAKDLAEATTPVDRHLAGTAVRGALVLTGVGTVAVAYATLRDGSLPVSLPDREAGTLVALATASAAALAGVTLLPAALTYGIGTDHLVDALASTPADLADRTAIFVGVFVAGMALLYHGLVQGAFRRVFDRDQAVAATTLLSAYFVTAGGASPVAPFRSGPWLGASFSHGVVAVLVVVALGAVVYAVEGIDDRRVRAAAALPVVLAVALAVVALVQAVRGPWGVLSALTRVALVGVAAYTYDGTDSLLAPALVYLTYALASLVVQLTALGALLAA